MSTVSTRAAAASAGPTGAGAGAISATSSASVIQPPGQLVDDLIDGHVAGVELNGVLGPPEGIGLAALVECVTPGHVGGDRLVVEVRNLCRAALGTDLGAGVQVHLEHRVREHDRSDVAGPHHAARPLVRPLPPPAP